MTFPGIVCINPFNTLTPGKLEWKFRYVIFKQILVTDGWGISCEIVLKWMSLGLHWWSVNIGSGNGLMPSGNKPLPEPMLTQISVEMASLGHNELRQYNTKSGRCTGGETMLIRMVRYMCTCAYLTRCVDGTPMSEVTPSLSSTSTHPTIVKQRSRSWWWTIDSYPFRSMSICPPISEVRLFQTLTLKKQGQGHGWSQKERPHRWPSIQLICFLFVSNQSDQKFLTWSYFKIWPWKIQGQGHGWGQRSRSHSWPSMPFFCLKSIAPTILEIWPIECLTLKKYIRLKKNVKKMFPTEFLQNLVR